MKLLILLLIFAMNPVFAQEEEEADLYISCEACLLFLAHHQDNLDAIDAGVAAACASGELSEDECTNVDIIDIVLYGSQNGEGTYASRQYELKLHNGVPQIYAPGMYINLIDGCGIFEVCAPNDEIGNG